jgi:hypothetical protein
MTDSYSDETAMKKTIKIAISLPEAAFKKIESLRRRTGKTRSQIIREAVVASAGEIRRGMMIREKETAYGTPGTGEMIDQEERKRRAIAAAGRFHSGLTDLATDHDRYLEESYAPAPPAKGDRDRD